MAPVLLQLKNISKSFPGVKALSNVSFDLHAGEVMALLGENGAGKSTLMKILSGVYQKDEGDIYKNGEKIKIHNTKDAMNHGINIVYQEFNLCSHLTVAQNIYLAREFCDSKIGFVLHERKQNEETGKIMAMLKQNISPTEKLGNLSVAQQQMVEIAKALSVECDILVMDEPSAALTESEIENLFGVIEKLKSQGKGIVYISHRLHELEHIADRVTVLRDGQYIDTLNYKDTNVGHLINLMVGRDMNHLFPSKINKPRDKIIFEVKNISEGKKLNNISFSLREGEILGIAGLMGAGRTELARAIFGADIRTGGEIYMHGQKISINSPLEAIKHGLGYLTEDRKKDGLLLNLNVMDNIVLASIDDYSPVLVMQEKRIQMDSLNYIDQLKIKTPSVAQKTGLLSGGNQQKVILARWLVKHCKVLIFDEPTRGIDVGAKYEIYELVLNLVSKGVGIIMISSELPELIGMCDRVLVMNSGHLTGQCHSQSKEMTQENIMHMATAKVVT